MFGQGGDAVRLGRATMLQLAPGDRRRRSYLAMGPVLHCHRQLAGIQELVDERARDTKQTCNVLGA